MRKFRLPAWVVLTLISLVAALLLGATYEMTKTAIANQEIEKASATRRELLPDAVSFEDRTGEGSLASLYEGLDAAGNSVGFVATTLTSGYGGEIEIVIGLNTEGTLTGIRVGGANFSETPGLGARAKEAAFTDQFAGLTAPITLNEDVDAITSATITSNAVVRGVNSAVSDAAKVGGFGGEESGLEAGMVGDGFYAIAQGFAGPVYVEIVLDENGAISGIVIGDESFNETSGYGAKAQEPTFYEQFIGLSGEIVLNEQVDAISGATFTSTAVVDAVNAALAASENAVETGMVSDGRYYARTEGFGGPVYVEIAVDENSAITDIIIGDENFNETSGFGAKAKEPAFYEQFMGLSGEIVLRDDVDAVSGATVTSEAVVKAVNTALARASGARIVLTAPSADADTSASATVSAESEETIPASADADTTASATGSAEEPAATEIPAADADTTASATGSAEEDAADTDAAAEAGMTEDGRYYATKKGYVGPVYVEIALDENGVITDIVIGDAEFKETTGLGAKAQEPAFYEQFIGLSGEIVLGEDVDAISSATVTSTAVVDAVNAALSAANDTATVPAADADTAASATGAAEEPAATEIPAADVDTTASATGAAEESNATESPAADADTTASATASAEDDSAIETGTTEDGHYFARLKGYVGPVYVELTLDENGVITDIVIGDEEFKETAGLGAKAQEPAFYEQFIGLSGEIVLGEDVDAISSATITSETVVKAVNAALEEAK